MKKTPILDRLADKFTVGDGCWEWTAAKDADSYGTFGVNNRGRLSHRIIYELLVGPIGEGLTLDHLCRVRHCVRPDHLEPVTNRENILRGESNAAVNARKTECPYGHRYDEGHVYVRPNGGRECRTCSRIRLQEWRRARKDPS